MFKASLGLLRRHVISIAACTCAVVVLIVASNAQAAANRTISTDSTLLTALPGSDSSAGILIDHYHESGEGECRNSCSSRSPWLATGSDLRLPE
jgi:hypothetical protein